MALTTDANVFFAVIPGACSAMETTGDGVRPSPRWSQVTGGQVQANPP